MTRGPVDPGEVQRDGRIPFTELGRRVNLSASATTERSQAAGGAKGRPISGYRRRRRILTKVGTPSCRRAA
ncbi:hypothetical protein GCM10020220_005300 [Nonomuraea rubra]|uniref:AsnC family transcriptional regulator n=1 Tax=Nonomuraea rubra TaxID=46180 RepID=UPI00336D8B41